VVTSVNGFDPPKSCSILNSEMCIDEAFIPMAEVIFSHLAPITFESKGFIYCGAFRLVTCSVGIVGSMMYGRETYPWVCHNSDSYYNGRAILSK